MSRRRLSLPPLPTHVAFRGFVVQGFSHTPLFAHAPFRGIAGQRFALPPLSTRVAFQGVVKQGFFRTSLPTHEVIRTNTNRSIIDIFPMSLRASMGMRKFTTTRNVSCTDKSGSVTPKRPPPQCYMCREGQRLNTLPATFGAGKRQPL